MPSSSYESSSAAPTSAPMSMPGGTKGESERETEMGRYWPPTSYTDDSGHGGGYTDDDGSYSYHFPEEFSHTETFVSVKNSLYIW